ncbi:alpha-2-macroglobulin [Agaricicola taiwanensis]|uniref:Alpha-2-macroglobulin n=1 Tax=Agaricicola taiwanensis TaxID=591372 RepID=A0A8J2VLS6_9RHOB|nr:alpha-2-macroglobulin [Agaricicola taiwanensis]GGE30545.1 alpha-2-macroglobulin [Agaricicola taiwanensis]
MAVFSRLAVVLALLLALPAQALADKTFARPEMAQEALRLEAQLKREASGQGKPAADWIKEGVAAVRASDWPTAAQRFAAALSEDPASEQAWRNLAVAKFRIDDDQNRYTLQRDAAAAAYKAYLLSPDARAEARALALFAEISAARYEFRPALDAYAASLRLAANAEIRATYEQLREEHGFRMVDYTIDNDAAAPRACVNFSETLAEGRMDFSPFVSVEGMDRPAVTAEGSQLCIDGLRHGETYEAHIRSGLPSSVGEDLLKTVDLTLYVRDRSASVRFTGRNYVLPTRGQNGIPLVSVNTDEVNAELYRINDRGLAPAVISGEFQKQLDSGDFQDLTQSQGAKVWAGSMPVKSRLNEDVTTAFPVGEAAGPLEAGVYVLVARPKDSGEPDWNETYATQWFVVSDLGISSISARDGVHVVVRSLATAKPVRDATLDLVARSNEILGSATTDDNGYASFPGGLARGTGASAPALVTARAGDSDYAFLDMTQAAFDLSDRGVKGRPAPGPLDAFVVTERGVYRPGETVHVTALLRDHQGLAERLPLTLVVQRPDGAEDRRALVADAGDGGRTYDLDLIDSATTGTWRVRAYADPKGPVLGATAFLVEDYVPERLDMEIGTKAAAIAAGRPATVELTGRWLYGAPAAELAAGGELTVREAEKAPEGYADYRFGLADESFAPVRTALVPATTDAQGRAQLSVVLPATLPATTKTLEAGISVSLREPGGRVIERSLALPVTPANPRIGVRPLFADRVGEGETANFDVVLLAPDNARAAAPLKWELSRLERRYQWYQEDGNWRYETITGTTRVANGTVNTAADAAARISAKVGWGEYRLEVTTSDAKAATSVEFDAGWNASANADTPDALPVALDKPSYPTGATAQLRIEAPFAGTATVAVVDETVRSIQTVDVAAGEAEVPLSVGDDWGAGAYVLVSLARPLDEKASRMPGRAVGLAWLSTDATSRRLDLSLDAAAEARPREIMTVPITVGNFGAGETARLVVAAVDVGILNLTGYEAPKPTEWFYGQRGLGAEMRDLYGQLIDGMRAERGAIRSGGDMPDSGIQASPPTQEPLALFSGIVETDAQGKAEVSFDLPQFNGEVKVMAIAWTADKLGEAEADVTVADPVVVTAATPRFLAVGDQSRVRLDLHNARGPAGNYRLAIDAEGPVTVSGAREHTIALAADGRQTVDVAIEGTGVGAAELALTLTGPDGAVYDQQLALMVRPAQPAVARRLPVAIRNNHAEIGGALVAGFLPDTSRVTISAGPLSSFDVAGRLAALDQYAYSCSEQVTSKALPLLYVSDLDATGLFAGVPVGQRIEEAITRVLARQNSTGSFGLWSTGSGDLWLNAYITDFLTRAREKGHDVPERAMSLALDQLKNTLSYQGEVEDGGGADTAYANYVLARNGRGRIGDLRYLADAKLDALGTPLARAQVGAALAIMGDRDRAESAFASARDMLEESGDADSRTDYGSGLRDGAAILALAAETDTASAIVPAVSKRLDEFAAEPRALSTQENAWMVLAARAFREQAAKSRLTVGGAEFSGQFERDFSVEDLNEKPVQIASIGSEPLRLSVTVSGNPVEPEGPAEEGFILTRRYYTMEGQETDPSRVTQNEQLVVVLTVTEPEPRPGRVLVVDHLPAGFEIDNPRLLKSGDTATLSWLPEQGEAEHAEFRDDRFVAAFDRTQGNEGNYGAAYVVRAVAPGSYAHPPATVEDMYRPERFARTGTGRVEVTAAR